MANRCFAALAVLAEQLPSAFRGLTPPEVPALEVPRTHALTAFAHNSDRRAMQGNLNLHGLSRKAGVKRVVDQLHQGVCRRPVIRKKRGGDLRIDPLANRYPSHVPFRGEASSRRPGQSSRLAGAVRASFTPTS